MYKYLIIIYIIFSSIILSCASHNTKYDNPVEWKHFNIYARTDEDIIFRQLQEDLDIRPLMESYLITVDLRIPDNQFVIIGGENNSGSVTFPWKKLRKSVQDGLIKWDLSNKEKL